MLKRFNHHVEKELEDVIAKLPLIIPTPEEQTLNHQYFQTLTPNTECQKTFVNETGLHYPKYNEFANVKLSKRQKEIIHWYLLGKSEPDTAAILNLSVETIHDYFKRLKLKFNCYSKTQLLLKLIDGGFIDDIDWKTIY